jgi:hypothetical protein
MDIHYYKGRLNLVQCLEVFEPEKVPTHERPALKTSLSLNQDFTQISRSSATALPDFRGIFSEF